MKSKIFNHLETTALLSAFSLMFIITYILVKSLLLYNSPIITLSFDYFGLKEYLIEIPLFIFTLVFLGNIIRKKAKNLAEEGMVNSPECRFSEKKGDAKCFQEVLTR